MTTETNAERLMRIKKHWHKYDTDVTQTDFWWLIQQAERVQVLVDENIEIRQGYQERSKRTQELEKALKFYADENTYEWFEDRKGYAETKILEDNGDGARQALKGPST